MFALVDGNNFYCSAERIFRPSLVGKPLVVLSNNDSCAVARSEEAKALGVKMGQPWFQFRDLADQTGLVALSANFALYCDISSRMMSLAAGLGPTQEVYSIDESFIGLHGVKGDLVRRGRAIRARILQWIGVPTGIGMGRTKTLAKLANHVSKDAERKPGSYPADLARVCNLAALPPSDFDAILAATPVQEIWGVGPRIGKQLRDGGITTALDLARMDAGTVRRRWSVVLERTVRELQGQHCIELENSPAPKQQIACTRSFGHPVTSLADLTAAVTTFAGRVAAKLRKQCSVAGQVMVFVQTSPFRRHEKQYSRGMTVPLRRPSADSTEIAQAACAGLQAIYRPGINFARAGVMLLELSSSANEQLELALDADTQADTRVGSVIDKINDRFGRGTVLLAGSGTKHPAQKPDWEMKQERRTPAYTTSWADLPIARA